MLLRKKRTGGGGKIILGKGWFKLQLRRRSFVNDPVRRTKCDKVWLCQMVFDGLGVTILKCQSILRAVFVAQMIKRAPKMCYSMHCKGANFILFFNSNEQNWFLCFTHWFSTIRFCSSDRANSRKVLSMHIFKWLLDVLIQIWFP